MIDWSNWTKLKNPLWYKRITNAMPIYNVYNQDLDTFFNKLGKAAKNKQVQLMKSMEKSRLLAVATVDTIDHDFVESLYMLRMLYKAHEHGFDSEKFSTLMKQATASKKKSKRKPLKKKKSRKKKQND